MLQMNRDKKVKIVEEGVEGRERSKAYIEYIGKIK
jgi:hypothetical protein